MPFLIDNSVVSGWYLDNQATPYTQAVAKRLQDDRAWALALWELELTNVLQTSCLHQRLTGPRAQAVLGHLGALPIVIDRETPSPREMLALALRFGLSSYNAAYLELALRQQSPIATQDAELQAAAVAAGVGVIGG